MNSEQKQSFLSYRQLVSVLGILLFLTAITVTVSRFDLGALNIWIAILIATVKATVVLLFFMELRRENHIVWMTFLITVFILAIFVGFIFWDVSFR